MVGGVTATGTESDKIRRKSAFSAFLSSWRFLIPAAVACGLAGGSTPNFYENHNVFFESEGVRHYRKVDGLLSHTCVEVHPDGNIEVSRHPHFGPSLYYEYNSKTHEIESIYRGTSLLERNEPLLGKRFRREKHASQYPGLFALAKQEAEEQLQRFGIPY